MKISYLGERISVDEAAEMLSMSPQQIRILMKRGKLPIGIVDKAEQAKNSSYYIYRGRIEAYLRGVDLAAN